MPVRPKRSSQPYVVDGSKCISYFTIELKGAIPEAQRGHFDNWASAVTSVRQVCPWNRFSKPHAEPGFTPDPELLGPLHEEWHGMTEVVFERLFEGSAVKRTKYEGLKRNLEIPSGGCAK
jgi:epoxyqueuosine reductase